MIQPTPLRITLTIELLEEQVRNMIDAGDIDVDQIETGQSTLEQEAEGHFWNLIENDLEIAAEEANEERMRIQQASARDVAL